VDKKFQSINDKTWCFWINSSPPFPELIHSSWNKFEFGDPNGGFEKSMGHYSYYMIKSIDFYSQIFDFLKTNTQIELFESDITQIGDDEIGSFIICNQEKIRGSWIFNSSKLIILEEGKYYLKQHFKGRWIRCKEPIFRKDSMVLMDFGVDQLDSPCFMYLLPTTTNSALIEFTSFSKHEFKSEIYTHQINKYLQKKYPGVEFEMIEEEAGVIPMTDTTFSPSISNQIINIGTPAGAVKPTTGYAFLRIQQQVEELVHYLENPQGKIDLRPKSGRFLFYDKLLLYLLDQQKDQAWKIFSALFRNSSPQLIFKFLEEKTNIFEEAKIFLGLPVSLFLKALYAVYFKSFRLALNLYPND
jgi:lycopene beta-cyclase